MQEVVFHSGSVSLSGSLWLPDSRTIAAVVMVGGSGDADRNNDVLFPPIREHLVAHGIAVLSYDKRGVGRSTGSWQSAGLYDLAGDAEAALELLLKRTALPGAGLFGHSQGGWVVPIVAARNRQVQWMITNSGPGVSPRAQAVYETRSTGLAPRLGDLPAHGFLDFQPEPVLESVNCPTLAIFGERDRLVPVDQSVAVFQRAFSGNNLTVRVFAGADHRIQVEGGRFADGYLDLLADWIGERLSKTSSPNRSGSASRPL
jgi:pimeloyl-ACP methyl ester carboxylesterase